MPVISAQVVTDAWDLCFLGVYAQLQVVLVVVGASVLARDLAVIADLVAA
jgi:hypothetical protein